MAVSPNRVLVIQDSTDRREAEVFRAHAPPHGVCDNLINALELLAQQQLGGANPVDVLVEASKNEEGKRRWTSFEGSSRWKTFESLSVLGPKYTTNYRKRQCVKERVI